MSELTYIQKANFEALLSASLDSKTQTQIFADLCRLNTLSMIAEAGSGHIGSSFSAMDIVAWLYLNEMRGGRDASAGQDLYFSSKGHDAPGLYSVLLALGKLDFPLVHQLRRLEGLPGHPDVHTPGMVTNTGSLGMGISKAKGMIWADRLDKRDRRIYVLTGDGELQEGQFWESLGSAVNHRMGELTVIVDHNKIQSDTWVQNVSDLGDLEAKFKSFGWHTARIDGHDLDQIEKSLADAKAQSEIPSIIIADTIKGRGVSFMESTIMPEDMELYPYHSGAPSPDDYDKASSELLERSTKAFGDAGLSELQLEKCERPVRALPDEAQKLMAAYAEALVAEGKKNDKIVALDGDLVLDTGLIPFTKEFPDRFIECGIAEMDMVSQAGGLALNGYLPVAHSFACFLSPRPNEQIYNNATEDTRCIYVGSLAGLLPGGPGHSHQCVRDIASLAAMPNMVLFEPCNAAEVKMGVEYLYGKCQKSVYLRLVMLPRVVPFELPDSYQIEEGKGVVIREGKDIALIGYGPVLLPEAYLAAQKLESEKGISVRIINLPWLNVVDTDWLAQSLEGCSKVITLDNHFIKDGQGEMLAAKLANHDFKISHMGLDRVPDCGLNDEVLKSHGLDAESIAQKVTDIA